MDKKQLNEEMMAEKKVLKEYGESMMEEFGQIPDLLVDGLIDSEMGRVTVFDPKVGWIPPSKRKKSSE